MASQIALDYATHRLRILAFDGSSKRIRVQAVIDVDLDVPPTDDDVEADDLRADAIAAAMKAAKLPSDPSAMAFDAGQALFREFDLPFTDAAQIAKVVRFEAESHIPLDIDDVVMQHLVLRKTRDKSHVLAAAVKKDDLLDRFDVLDASGIDPHFVDLDAFALFHALAGTGVAAEHPDAVVVSVQPESTTLLFLAGGELYAVRSLRMGTHSLHSAGTRLEANEQEVELARTHDFLGRLKRELRRTLTSLPPLEIPVVLVTGSGSRVPGFADAMREVFAGEVRELDFLAHVDHKLSAEEVERYGPDIGVALGIAYKLFGLEVTQTDFRRDECAYARKFDQVKSPLIVLSFLIFLVVALQCIDAVYRNKTVNREYDLMINWGDEALKMVLGDEAAAHAVWQGVEGQPQRVQAIHTRMEKEFSDLAAKLGRGDRLPWQPSALAAWIEFMEKVEANEKKLGRLLVSRLDIDVGARTPQFKVSGVMESRTKVDELIRILEEDPLYEDVRPSVTSATDDGMVRFDEIVADIDLAELERRVKEGIKSAERAG
ncbi:MAG: pilus assembly protein PilM [Planctomycetes bacterium]|nr:pilus assembly protein PilM [Planctomycetota bacterium]